MKLPHRVGRLGKPSGLQGFIGIYVDDADLVHFEPASQVTIAGVTYVVREIRRGAKGHEVAFEGVNDRNAAENLRGNDVSVAQRRELGPNEYWPEDLVGLAVAPGGGEVVGVVSGQAQDRIVIERHGRRFEVPFVDELVPVVDVEGGVVHIIEIEGLSQD